MRIICRKGSKNVSKIGCINEKVSYTALAWCYAAGVFLQLHILFEAKLLCQVGVKKPHMMSLILGGWRVLNFYGGVNLFFGKYQKFGRL